MTIADSADGLGQTISSRKRASFFRGYWREFQEWRKRARIRAELSSFSDRELRDIGVTRSEIDYIAWNGPTEPRGGRSGARRADEVIE
jgi:uncharacterized protein YjiS (DUF1127 family)